jgi:sulfur carrier protein ThiS
MVIGADNAALEDGEEVLGGVAVLAIATAKLAVAVNGRAVLRELAADAEIETGIVGHKRGRTVRVGNQSGTDIRVIDVRDVERAGASAALH